MKTMVVMMTWWWWHDDDDDDGDDDSHDVWGCSAGRNRAGQGKETTRCSLAGWLFPSYSHIHGVPRKVVHRILRLLSGWLFKWYCHDTVTLPRCPSIIYSHSYIVLQNVSLCPLFFLSFFLSCHFCMFGHFSRCLNFLQPGSFFLLLQSRWCR